MRYIIVAFFLFLLLATGVSFWVEFTTTVGQGIFSPLQEQIRNDTFHNSQAYTDGMKMQLAKMLYEFNSTSDHDQKSAICALVRSDYGAYDSTRLSLELETFVLTCKEWH